jgi:hypothetical protein
MRSSAVPPSLSALFVLSLAALVPLPAAADVEDTLRARLRGRWGVLRSPVGSECTDHYTDNQVAGRHAGGAGPYTLPAGELVSIDNVHVGWTRFDVNLGLLRPYRVSLHDGPFTLHEHRSCRVQLSFDVPREVKRDAARAEAAVLEILEVHDSEAAARRSELWNGRDPEPLPADTEAVWAEYRVWKAEQVNLAVREKLDQVLALARDASDSMPDDAEYRESFALGVAARRWDSPGECPSLLSASFYVSGSGGSDSRGWEDGQRVGWALAVAHGLLGCFVETPEVVAGRR